LLRAVLRITLRLTRGAGTELEYTLSDDAELIDWSKNNMNWADLKHHAVQLPTDPLLADYDGEWSNADMEVER
jgi:hypothetical protein